MTPGELSSLLLLYAKQFYDSIHDYARLSYLTDDLSRRETDWDRLQSTIPHTGAITGQSSRTEWSVIAISGEDVFVARLTEVEDDLAYSQASKITSPLYLPEQLLQET